MLCTFMHVVCVFMCELALLASLVHVYLYHAPTSVFPIWVFVVWVCHSGVWDFAGVQVYVFHIAYACFLLHHIMCWCRGVAV